MTNDDRAVLQRLLERLRVSYRAAVQRKFLLSHCDPYLKRSGFAEGLMEAIQIAERVLKGSE
jgi:hypothetical protein